VVHDMAAPSVDNARGPSVDERWTAFGPDGAHPGGASGAPFTGPPLGAALWLTRTVVHDGADARRGSWSRLTSTSVFSSPWFETRRDTALRPDGSTGLYDHVVSTGSATVVAVDEAGLVAVTRQWIYTHGGVQWRLPAGRIETADQDAESAAQRELREETGISAREWRLLGVINCADSFTNHRDHAFFATGLTQGTPCLDPGEADLEIRRIPFEQALSLVVRGEMPHAGSSYALLMARTLGLG
jgi:8-oxo-dGTP pyrophosphatase MutT (NUDIX family)